MITPIRRDEAGHVVMLDQRRLPHQEIYLTCRTAQEVAEAIRNMVIRGAPAIGVAAAMGLALGARSLPREGFAEGFRALCDHLADTRPTAVNLFWAIGRMQKVAAEAPEDARVAFLDAEAERIFREDLATNRTIGAHGVALLPDGARVLTHCNTGSLATAGYGTALGVVRAAHQAGKRPVVFAGETRPYLQGSRLTAWECRHDGIDVTVIADVAAGHLMAQGAIDLAIVGADRIAANGDVANKIGTYTVATLCQAHGLPFYVAAPTSSIDLAIPTGAGIPIEERDPDEVRTVFGHPITLSDIPVRNPAFDVTPHRLVTAIITERGVARAPYQASLALLLDMAGPLP
jgi:methylthioribose-1-phosphate isomerase